MNDDIVLLSERKSLVIFCEPH